MSHRHQLYNHLLQATTPLQLQRQAPATPFRTEATGVWRWPRWMQLLPAFLSPPSRVCFLPPWCLSTLPHNPCNLRATTITPSCEAAVWWVGAQMSHFIYSRKFTFSWPADQLFSFFFLNSCPGCLSGQAGLVVPGLLSAGKLSCTLSLSVFLCGVLSLYSTISGFFCE